MSKKTATIILTIVILLIAGGFLAFYFYSNQGKGSGLGGIDTRENIFPAGGGSGTAAGGQVPGTATSGSGQASNNVASGAPVPILKELSTRPSAGAVALATSSLNLVRFIEKGTGNVYEVSPENSAETRLSNTTISKIEEALWNNDGTQTIARYTADDVDLIKTYSAKLSSKSATDPEGKLQGSFMTDSIEAVVKNPSQNKIFYLLPNSAGSTGIIADFDGGKKSQIFDSLLQEWLVDWPTSGFVALNTKPSAGVPGYLFLLNTRTGSLTRAISRVSGLTTLVDPAGSSALYSESASQRLFLRIYSFKNGTVLDAPVTTLPEKCVWSKNDLTTIYCSVPSYMPDGDYPDIWYQGRVQFSDEIWQINAKNGAGKLLATLKKLSGKDIDGINLFLSPDENYLFFTNKSDSHLWSLRLVP